MREIGATDVDGLLLGDFKTGDRIGDYQVDGRRPSHGSGIVYTAVHVLLPRRVAIKVIPAAHAHTKSFAAQLLREACIVDALDHPGVPRVYECGVLPDQRAWVATELVGGPALQGVLAGRTLAPEEVALVVRDVADVLAHIHARGLIHHAIRPDTITIPDRDHRFSLCVHDWSAARTLDSVNPVPLLARSSDLPYVAPEVVDGGTGDDRADVFALGALAYQALHGAPPGPGAVVHSASPMLAALVAQMLAPEPATRPAAADVLASTRWLTGGDLLAPARLELR